MCFSKLGNHKKALTLTDDVLSNNPNNAEALYNKSLILGRLHRNSESLYFLIKRLMRILINLIFCLKKDKNSQKKKNMKKQ